MVVSVCSICVLLCVCKCMYVCFLDQGRTAMPLSLNYKSNQTKNSTVVLLIRFPPEVTGAVKNALSNNHHRNIMQNENYLSGIVLTSHTALKKENTYR